MEGWERGGRDARESRGIKVLEAESAERLRQERLRTELLRLEIKKVDPMRYQQIRDEEKSAAVAKVKSKYRDFGKHEARIMSLAEELVLPLDSPCSPERYFEYLYIIAKALSKTDK